MSSANDSHISKPTKGNETNPIPMHKRSALGERVSGQSNPNGAARGSTTNKVSNNHGKTY